MINEQDGSINSIVTGKDYVPATLVKFPEPQNIARAHDLAGLDAAGRRGGLAVSPSPPADGARLILVPSSRSA